MNNQVLAIGDISTVGKCSLVLTLPILNSCGITTSILPSSLLSTHMGFQGYTLLDLKEEMEKIIAHYEQLNLTFSHLYTNFFSSSKQIELILQIIKKKTFSFQSILVDPVLGDHNRSYKLVTKEMIQKMIELVKEATIITPNLTEAKLLLGQALDEKEINDSSIKKMLVDLADLGPNHVIITGVSLKNEKISVYGFQKNTNQFYKITTSQITGNYHGTGDIFSSILSACYLCNLPMKKSVQIAMNFIKKCIVSTNCKNGNSSLGLLYEQYLSGLSRIIHE